MLNLIPTVRWRGSFLAASALGVLLGPWAAQASFVTCGESCQLEDLLRIPAQIYNWATAIAVSVLMIFILVSGVRMILHFASDAPESELRAAKETLRYALFGFAVVILSYVIVSTVGSMFYVLADTSLGAKFVEFFNQYVRSR